MQRGHRVIAWATCTLLLISSLGYAFTVYPRQWQAAQRYYSDLQVVQERNTGTMALILGKEQKAGVLLRLKNDNLYPQVSRESCAGSATNAFFVVCEEDYQTPDTGIAWIRASWK